MIQSLWNIYRVVYVIYVFLYAYSSVGRKLGHFNRVVLSIPADTYTNTAPALGDQLHEVQKRDLQK